MKLVNSQVSYMEKEYTQKQNPTQNKIVSYLSMYVAWIQFFRAENLLLLGAKLHFMCKVVVQTFDILF